MLLLAVTSGIEGHDCQGVSGWLAFARGGVCLWLCIAAWQTRHEHPKAYHFSRYTLAANLLILALLTLAALLPFSPTLEPNDLGALSAALLVSLSAPLGLWLFRRYRQAYVPMNAELAAERFSLIYIVSLGEIVLRYVARFVCLDHGMPWVVVGLVCSASRAGCYSETC